MSVARPGAAPADNEDETGKRRAQRPRPPRGLQPAMKGAHRKQTAPSWGVNATQRSRPIPSPDPWLAECLRAGTGMGGTVGKPRAEPLHAAAPPVAGPSVKATTKRYNPPNTFFRKLFERGDLPIRVKHTGSGIRVDWTKPADKVDLHHFLPVFVSGLREVEEPYMSLAQFGTQDLLAVGGDRLLPVVPQLVQPLREALATRDPGIVRRVMLVMQRLVTCGDLVGEALVPFYRQLLPVLSIFKSKHGEQLELRRLAVTRRCAPPLNPVRAAPFQHRLAPQTTSAMLLTTASGSVEAWATWCKKRLRLWSSTGDLTPSSISGTV